MKRQKSCGPRLGKLVHQLPEVITFAYDLHFRSTITRWKGIVEEIHFGGSIILFSINEKLYLEKPSFRPSKWSQRLKLLKIVNCQNCQKTLLGQLEKVGGHGYPPRSHYLCMLDRKKNYFRFYTCSQRCYPHDYESFTQTYLVFCKLPLRPSHNHLGVS
jgi:hypothetical protein